MSEPHYQMILSSHTFLMTLWRIDIRIEGVIEMSKKGTKLHVCQVLSSGVVEDPSNLLLGILRIVLAPLALLDVAAISNVADKLAIIEKICAKCIKS